jgi:hypothetical protein
MKLGTLLLRNAAIGLSQLEAALRNQVVYGGRLGTNLVELGFLDLEILSGYLGEMTTVPVATPAMLDAADKTLLTKLTGDDAHRLRAIPLSHAAGGMIAVAMVDPTDAAGVEALATQLGAPIAPHVVPELRALYYLEKHYGLSRRARFVRSARVSADLDSAVQPLTAAAAPDDRRRSQPAGMAMPPAFTLEPRRRRTSSQAPFMRAGEAMVVAYGEACERIDSAADRDAIAEAFIDYAKGRCDALVVFLIRDGNAIGWRGYVSGGGPAKPLEELSLPLGGASALQSAHDAGAPFVGAPPSAARPIETQLWQVLRATPEPVEVAVVPVMVKDRAVNLIYAHVLGLAPGKALVDELCDLAQRAQGSYTRLIRAARGS